MNIFLADNKCREALFPFTLTRHTADIRIGILTIKEKWEKITGTKIYTSLQSAPAGVLHINANIVPTLKNIEVLLKSATDKTVLMENEQVKVIHHPWQIFQLNDWALRADFELLTQGRSSAKIDGTNKLINEENIFVEDGAIISHSILNAADGPIYIGKNAQVLEGNMIRGSFAMCANSTLKMGSKVYGATTIGPYCSAAGEIKNTVLFAYSNKAHDGYLGDSVIGEWCNLGAGTSNSNVKNTAGDISYFLNNGQDAVIAGFKGGLLMGDYSRCAVNTTFNTGAVAGVCCNIFGDVSARKYIHNFSWGNEKYIFDKAIKDIASWKKMKGQQVTEEEVQRLKQLYEQG